MEKIRALIHANAMQCEDGTWDFDPYMHGMANGMIYMLSVIFGEEPQYKDAPKKWLVDSKKVQETLYPLEKNRK